jgi:hypothetical protein
VIAHLSIETVPVTLRSGQDSQGAFFVAELPNGRSVPVVSIRQLLEVAGIAPPPLPIKHTNGVTYGTTAMAKAL